MSTIIYEFGEFQLDPANHLLSRRDGTPVPLTSRVFDTLVFMVEHHGTVLDKERLMEAVWSDSIVEENNLAQSISKLRQVLGEKPGTHRFIVTVPGRGYRFAADVVIRDGIAENRQSSSGKLEAQPAPTATKLAPAVSEPKVAPAWPLPRRAVIALLVMIALGAGVLLVRSRKAPPAPPAPAALPQKSIAVLPFENLSDDKQNAYFAAGIQDDVLTSLAQIHELKVISHTSVLAYRPGAHNMREVGQALGVANVLEGSVRRAGDRVLINVQLIDTRTDRHLWAERYDRTVADSIGLQGELAREIAEALKAQLAPEEKASLETKPTDNPEAYALYLQARGRERASNRSYEHDRATEQLYAEAIALDPKFALAHARRSILNSDLAFDAGEKAARAQARSEAEEALRLSPSLGEGHTALGLSLYWADKNYAAALKEFSIAAATSPNEPDILTYIGGIYRRQGRWRESLATFQRAEGLDPRNRYVFIQAANSHLYVRDWPGASAGYKRALEIAPASAIPMVGLAYLEIFQNNSPAAGRKILQSIPPGIDPDGMVTEARWDLAMLERDYAGAERILTESSLKNFALDEAFPLTFYKGRTALARGDVESAQRYLAAATPGIEERVRDTPEDPERRALLGLLYGYMQRKEDALREGRRAVELEPESQNAFHGAQWAANLALVYALVGEQDQAITLIERLLSAPGPVPWPDQPWSITLAELRLRWEWDSLRSNPRFQKILAAPEPKTILK